MKYEIVENPLKEGSYYIRLVQGETDTLEDLLLAVEGRTALSATDVKAVVDAIAAELAIRLPRRSVDLGPLGFHTLGARGSLDSPDDPLSDDIELRVIIRPYDELEDGVIKAVELEEIERRVFEPIVDYFLNIEPESREQYATANIGRLIGEHLKFDKADATQGVFFVAEDDTELRVSSYSHVAGKRVEFLIPPGLTGVQRIVVRARFGVAGKMRSSKLVGPLNPI